MSRTPVAALLGLLGFVLYVMVVVALADHVLQMHWAVQGLYFAVAGIAWTWPARALMIWAARGRRQG
jgi:hypothetical protein